MLDGMPPPEQVRTTVESYVELLSAGERDTWLDLFAEDATLTDPVPSEAHVGRSAIGSFWTGMTGMADRLVMRRHELHVCGNEAALVYTMILETDEGAGTAFDGVEIFTVDAEGLIVSARAYWDPSELRRIEAPDDRS
ncbi:MAG: nuclear transport factor 2 family protein [Actinomycetota bacterium]|nr:nuclear transport factor 2 family protein [Actinomycetota bacterium]